MPTCIEYTQDKRGDIRDFTSDLVDTGRYPLHHIGKLLGVGLPWVNSLTHAGPESFEKVTTILICKLAVQVC